MTHQHTEPMRFTLDELTNPVIDCSIQIHRAYGGGILESVYEAMLAHLLLCRGIAVKRQVLVPIIFDGIRFDEGFRIDLLVEEVLVVELKSIKCLSPAHTKQLLTHLRLKRLSLGLLLNFGGATMKEGIKRVVNDLRPDDSPLLRVNQPTE
ncbi:MAG: GxxExxY protein [Gemmatimonas sp.]